MSGTDENLRPEQIQKGEPRAGEFRVGVIGLGGMGTFHAHSLHVLAGVSVAVVADPHHPNLNRAAALFGAAVNPDPLAVAADPDLDGLVIASPDHTHAEPALAAIEAGIPVLCEKPLATTVADARRVVAAETAAEARSGGRLLQLGFMREYDEAHRQLQTALSDLGPVHHIRCVHRNAPSPPRPLQEIVGDSIVHDIHSVRFLTGAEFQRVQAHVSHDPDGRPRHVLVMAELSTGGHATLEFDDAAYAYEVSVEVTAERGTAATGQPLRAEMYTDGQRRIEIGTDWFARFAQAYRSEVEAWVAAARRGTATGPGAVDGLAAQIVVEAILESIDSGQPVSVHRHDLA